jgi:curli biogenesis system outer membrane secretion channel CsgG
VALVALSLGGCVSMRQARLGAGEEPTLIGPAVRDNRTPMDAALTCLAGDIAAMRARPLVIGVGDVRDYTGKYSVNEGNAITQGGALMVTSALGKLGGAVSLAERFDPTIAERELGYTDRRQLGDGQVHDVAGPAGAGKVPWLPYYGGSIERSDYYVVGGITELNYDIRSGGIDTEVSQLGPKARTFTQSVAIDLRIVDTRTLLVTTPCWASCASPTTLTVIPTSWSDWLRFCAVTMISWTPDDASSADAAGRVCAKVGTAIVPITTAEANRPSLRPRIPFSSP